MSSLKETLQEAEHCCADMDCTNCPCCDEVGDCNYSKLSLSVPEQPAKQYVIARDKITNHRYTICEDCLPLFGKLEILFTFPSKQELAKRINNVKGTQLIMVNYCVVCRK